VLHGCLKNGRITEVNQLFERMKGDGLKASVVTYTILINGYMKKKMVPEAIQACERMKGDGLKPNVVTYGH